VEISTLPAYSDSVLKGLMIDPSSSAARFCFRAAEPRGLVCALPADHVS
jgi:hypothetical protein